ncbi:MAG TPA: hypothetical protein VMF91_11885 [Bryobacteraceae bacterium]|nr:hypothetical protein [Bryobacteraceae bacterium]
MPKIRFAKLPDELRKHLLSRIDERAIKYGDLMRLQEWVASEPEAPDGNWYKDFGSFKLCGTGEFPKTVLTKGMKPFGDEIE